MRLGAYQLEGGGGRISFPPTNSRQFSCSGEGLEPSGSASVCFVEQLFGGLVDDQFDEHRPFPSTLPDTRESMSWTLGSAATETPGKVPLADVLTDSG